MKRNNVEILFDSNEIRINKQCFEKESDVNEESGPELLLNEATDIIKEEDFEAIISDYKKINQKLDYLRGFEINLNSNVRVAKKPYAVPYKLIDPLKKHINELLKLRIIRQSKSSYGSPAFVKLKPNGEVRGLRDYRELNSLTEKEAYPFTTVKDKVADLNGATICSQIDPEKGHYQITLSEEELQKTAYSVQKGQETFT